MAENEAVEGGPKPQALGLIEARIISFFSFLESL